MHIFARNIKKLYLNALVTDPCSLRHHPRHTASWCWCLPSIRSARAHQAKSSNLAGENILPTGRSHFLPQVCLASYVLLRLVTSCTTFVEPCFLVLFTSYMYWDFGYLMLFIMVLVVFGWQIKMAWLQRLSFQSLPLSRVVFHKFWICHTNTSIIQCLEEETNSNPQELK